MKKQHILLSIIAMVQCLAIASCKKFVEVAPPETEAEQKIIFANEQSANAAVVGLYANITLNSSQLVNGPITLYTALSSDELLNLSTTSTYDTFFNNSILSNNSDIYSKFWSNAYKSIYQTNAVIEGLDRSATLGQATKDKLKGEMLYMRALHYFYLQNLFKDVPLLLSSDYEKNAQMARTAKADVIKQVISDLKISVQLLTESYNSSSNLRPSKGSALALLAKVYLYSKDWQNAESVASEVINSGKYSMETLANAFLATSKETILQLSRQSGNTSDGSSFIPASASVRPTFGLTTTLLNAFETGDLRKINWIKGNTVSGITYYYPYKYKVRVTTPVTEYYIHLRLGELFLIRAEARANLEKLSDAIEDVDMIRARANIPKIKTTSPSIAKDALLAAIFKERQTELFAEWGNRWFDLKRTGQADAVLGISKAPNWQSTDQYYPIPQSELNLNPALVQNEGYY